MHGIRRRAQVGALLGVMLVAAGVYVSRGRWHTIHSSAIAEKEAAAGSVGAAAAPVATIQTDGQHRVTALSLQLLDRISHGDELASAAPNHRQRVSLTDMAWPCGLITFRFVRTGDAKVSAALEESIRIAIVRWQEATDLRFFEDEKGTARYVLEFGAWDEGWGVSAVGYQHGASRIYLPRESGPQLAMHEIGHAIGLYHAHQHPDRVAKVAFDSKCVEEDARKIFQIRPAEDFPAGYDIASVMHYRSRAFCKKDADDRDDDGTTDECSFRQAEGELRRCLPLRRVAGDCPDGACQDRDDDGYEEEIVGLPTPSTGDRKAIEILYQFEQTFGEQDPEERDFGKWLTSVDVDGDAQEDLVIGSRVDDHLRLRLYLARGGSYWGCRSIELPSASGQRFDESTSIATTLSPGDATLRLVVSDAQRSISFGFDSRLYPTQFETLQVEKNTRGAPSLNLQSTSDTSRSLGEIVYVDTDLDGIDERIVGLPTVEVGAKEAAGRIEISHRTHIDSWERSRFISSASQERRTIELQSGGLLSFVSRLSKADAGDHFGQSLAVADVTGDGLDDLLVWAPRSRWPHGEQRGRLFVYSPTLLGLVPYGVFEPHGLDSTADQVDPQLPQLPGAPASNRVGFDDARVLLAGRSNLLLVGDRQHATVSILGHDGIQLAEFGGSDWARRSGFGQEATFLDGAAQRIAIAAPKDNQGLVQIYYLRDATWQLHTTLIAPGG